MVIRSWRQTSSLVLLGALSACSHAGQAPVAASAPAPTKPGVPVALVAKATKQVAPAPVGIAVAHTPDKSPFVDGLRLGYVARLSPAGKSAVLSTEKLLLGIQDDRVTIEPPLLEGLHPGMDQFPRVIGSLPNAAWAVEISYMDRTSRTTLSHWTGSEWVGAGPALQGKNLVALSGWSNGRTLALVSSEYEKQLFFTQLAGPKGAQVPQLPYAKQSDYGCVHGIQPSAMSALPSGEVFLAGQLCQAGGDEGTLQKGFAVLRWGAGQTQGKATILPKLSAKEASEAQISSLVASAPDDVIVAGMHILNVPDGQDQHVEPYIARFDGRTWRTLSAPPIERIDELQRAPDGKLWALGNGELWVSQGSASETVGWQSVPVPLVASETGEHTITSFWVRDSDDVWATVGDEASSFLFRTQRGAQPLSAPSAEAVASLTQSIDPSHYCESPTLMLLTLSRQAPKNLDFPSIRAALRGHDELAGKAQFVEIPFLTRRYLGVRGDDDTLSQTEDILSQAGIAGIAPQRRCLTNVEPTRTLTMDFSGPKLDPPLKRKAKPTSEPRRSNRPTADFLY